MKLTILFSHKNQLGKSLFVITWVFLPRYLFVEMLHLFNSSILLSNYFIIFNNAIISLCLLFILFIKQFPVLPQKITIGHLNQGNKISMIKPEANYMWVNVYNTIQIIESQIDLINRKTDLYDPNFFSRQ